MRWKKVRFTGIEIAPKETQFIEQQLDDIIVYWSDADCKHWAPTFRTKPYSEAGFWCDVFDIDLVEESLTIHVFQRDEPMEGERLARHLVAREQMRALVD